MNSPLPSAATDTLRLLRHANRVWDEDIVARISQYIAVPAKSPAFDPAWANNAYLTTVVRDAAQWISSRKIEGLRLEIVEIEGRTPVLFFEVPASNGDGSRVANGPLKNQTVLMYGHLDKQPEFTGWRSDLGPWLAKYQDGRLYGRGGADDGYAVYAAITAVQALKEQQAPHPRIVGLIETSEESGSPDLLPYVDALKARLGDVGLVICLDSGIGFWAQTAS